MIEVRVPKDTRGIYLGEKTVAPRNEFEFLLGRGLNYRVVERQGNSMVLEVVNP